MKVYINKVQWWQGEDTWTDAPPPSWYGCQQPTCRWGTHSPSLDRWAAYKEEVCFWWRPLPVFEPLSSSPDRYEATRSTHPHEQAVLTQWIGSLRRCTTRGLGTHLSTFANGIAGPFETMGIFHSFTHCSRSPEIWLQVADKLCWLVGCGHDGRVICVKSQLEVVGWRRHVPDIQTGKDIGNYSTLSQRQPECHGAWMWLFGKTQVGRNGFYKVWGEIKDC